MMAPSIARLLAVCVLCLPLLGQDYGSGIPMVNVQPSGAVLEGCALWSNADFCEDFESSLSSDCVVAPIDVCVFGDSCDDYLNEAGTPDCNNTTTPLTGSVDAEIDAEDTTQDVFGWGHQGGDRNPTLECLTTSSTCEWRWKFDFQCTASSAAPFRIMLAEDSGGANELSVRMQCDDTNQADFTFDLLSSNCTTEIANIAEGTYSICIQWNPTDGVGAADGDLFFDTGDVYCSGVTAQCTITNATGTPATVTGLRFLDATADRNATLRFDNIAFDAAGTF